MHPQRSHFQGLDGDFEVVDWTGGRGEVQDVVKRTTDVDVFGDILMHEGEIGQGKQVLDVAHVSRDEVVHGNDLEPVFHKTVAEVRAQKACGTCDEYALGGRVAVHGCASRMGRPMER